MMPAGQKSNLTLNFFKVGLAYFLVVLVLGVLMTTGTAYRIFGPQGTRIAHVHAGLLGFVTMIIMGSMYQIVPTLTGTKLYGGGLSWKQFILMNIGVLGLFITQLLTGVLRSGFLIIFGLLVLLASALFAYIIFRTMGESRSKIQVVTIPFFKFALIFYLAGVTMGLLMVSFPRYFSQFFLGKTAHAHLGTLGFITMTIFGAEYQMFPMLSLQKLRSENLARISLWSLAVGAAGFWIGLMIMNTILLTLSTVVLLGSIYVFLLNMILTIRGAKWRGLDVSVKYLLGGHIFLFLTSAIGASMAVFYHLGLIDFLKRLGLAGEGFGIYRLIWTHAHLSLIGFVTLTIMGAMYHLAPMLVWMEKYGPKMGKEKVPNIQDLFSQKIALLILFSTAIGLVGLLIGQLYGNSFLIKSSAYVIGGSGAAFSLDMYRIML